MKEKSKCSCGAGNKITCPNCSKIKMVIMLKNGNTELKLKTTNNRYANPVWYSPLSKNRKPTQLIINSMYKRFEKSIYKAATNKVIFYNNFTKEFITSK